MLVHPSRNRILGAPGPRLALMSGTPRARVGTKTRIVPERLTEKFAPKMHPKMPDDNDANDDGNDDDNEGVRRR